MKFTLISSSEQNLVNLSSKELMVWCSDCESEKVFSKLKRIVLFVKKHYSENFDESNINYYFHLCRFLHNQITSLEFIEFVANLDFSVNFPINWMYQSASKKEALHIEGMNIHHLYNALNKSTTDEIECEMLQFELYYRLMEYENE